MEKITAEIAEERREKIITLCGLSDLCGSYILLISRETTHSMLIRSPFISYVLSCDLQ